MLKLVIAHATPLAQPIPYSKINSLIISSGEEIKYRNTIQPTVRFFFVRTGGIGTDDDGDVGLSFFDACKESRDLGFSRPVETEFGKLEGRDGT